VQQQFLNDSINLVLSAQFDYIERVDREIVIHYKTEGQAATAIVDQILVGAGRAPNVEGLNLAAVAVDYTTQRGIQIND
jgi:pyruvate/2-oxoglutarate dehydrogenase complex dihydrolipoamide dehydrogenase (E3) component